MAAYRQVMERANNVAQEAYDPYGGQLTAGVSGDQARASQSINSAVDAATPYYRQAAGAMNLGLQSTSVGQGYFSDAGAMLSNASNLTANVPGSITPEKFSGAAVEQYMNPYTQNVIDTTMANINRNNSIQAAGLTSNGIKSGNAFGGDRMGLAQAELARGQSMSSDQTIAGLWNQNYSQALGEFNNQQGVKLSAAQADRASALQKAAQAAQIGQAYAGVGSNYLSAGSQFGSLAGTEAGMGQGYGSLYLNQGQGQLASGALQQATDQAGLSAAYQQWQAQQSFPYAQTQWLSGIQSGLGSLSGGTSSTTGPAPNPFNQIIGAGTMAAGLFSDERVKEDIKEVGETHDGQKVYTYRYKGLPQTHMGLIAQEVEGDHPEAVGVSGGVKTVDYKAATRDAEVRRAAGGGVMPYGGMSFIPQIETKHGAGVGIPTARAPEDKPTDFKAAGSAINKLVDGMNLPQTGQTSAVAGASSGMMGGVQFPIFGNVQPSAGFGGMPAMFAAGGAVRRRGVAPRLRGYASGGSAFADRMDAVMEAVSNGDFDPVGANYTAFAPPGLLARGETVPVPRERPVDLEPIRTGGVYAAGEPPMTEARAAANFAGNDMALPAAITGSAGDDMPSNVMAFDRAAPRRGLGVVTDAAPMAAPVARPGIVGAGTQYERPETAAPEPQAGFGGLFEKAQGLMPHLSDHAKTALVTAGLAMMASRSPNVGNAIGEGGLAGMNAYAGSQKAERDAAMDAAKMANDQTRLGYEGQRVGLAADEARRSAAMAKLIPNGKGGMMPNPAYLAQLRAETEISDKSKPVLLGYSNGQGIYGVKNADGSYTDPISGKPVAEAVGAAESSAGLSGDEFLATRPEGERELVKKIANYDIDPKSLSSKGGHRERLLAAAAQYEPTFSQSNYASRYATRKDFTSGKSAQNLSSFNTTLGHLDTLDKAVDKLGNSDYPWWNSISGKAAVAGGNTKYAAAQKDFQTARTAVSDELTRAFRGSGGNVHDIKAWEAAIDQSDSPAALKAAVKQATELLRSRIESVGDAYNRGMGTQREAPELLSPKARKTLDRVLGHEGADGERGGEKTGAKPSAAGLATVSSKSEYDALKSGAEFIGSDGKRYRKP